MISRQPVRLKVVSYNIRCDSKTVDNDGVLSQKKVAKPFEYVFPVFITCKVVITNMKVQKFKWVKEGLKQQFTLEHEENKC